MRGVDDLGQRIDHTLLSADAQEKQIVQLCQEAEQFRFFSVCVHPWFAPLAVDKLRHTPVKVCSVVGFPLGQNMTSIKVREADELIELGCHEIDMVMNLSAFKDQNYGFVRKEISKIASLSESTLLKVIIETALLSQDEIKVASQVCVDGGADFVKTSTGFSHRGTSIDDISLIRSVVKDQAFIKASGGIKTREFAFELVRAGADRLGSSCSVSLVTGENL